MTDKNPPTHLAYGVKRDGRRRAHLVEIGVATMLKDGQGCDILLDRLPVGGFNGRIIVRLASAPPAVPETDVEFEE